MPSAHVERREYVGEARIRPMTMLAEREDKIALSWRHAEIYTDVSVTVRQ